MALALVMVSGLSVLDLPSWLMKNGMTYSEDWVTIETLWPFWSSCASHIDTRTHMLAHVFRKLSWRFWPEAILSTHKHQLSSRSTALKVRHHTEKILYTLTLFLHSNSSPSQQLQRGGGYMSKWKATFFFFFFFLGGKCCCVHWVFSRTHPVCAEV